MITLQLWVVGANIPAAGNLNLKEEGVQSRSFLFTCKEGCRISSSFAQALTSAVSLWILNVDILAHISDDCGVSAQDGRVSGSFCPHAGNRCGYRDDTPALKLLHVCMCPLVWRFFCQPPRIFFTFFFRVQPLLYKIFHVSKAALHQQLSWCTLRLYLLYLLTYDWGTKCNVIHL